MSSTFCGWWNRIQRGKITEQRKKNISLSIYIMWHIWKESGRRIFQNESMNAPALARLIRADIEMVALAKGVDEGMTPRSSILVYLVPAKEEARSKNT
jgi:hypothetical protein